MLIELSHKINVGSAEQSVHSVAEEVGRAPQHPDAALLLLRLHVAHNRHEVLVGRVEIDSAVRKKGGGCDVSVVKRVEFNTKNLEQFESSVDGVACALHGVRCRVPGERLASSSKDVAAVAEKRVPPHDGEAEVVL